MKAGDLAEQNRRMKVAADSYNEYGVRSEHLRPFCHDSVYSFVGKIRTVARTEANEYQRYAALPNRQPTDYWENAEKNAKAIEQLTDELCQAIQKRIGIMNVIYIDNLKPKQTEPK